MSTFYGEIHPAPVAIHPGDMVPGVIDTERIGEAAAALDTLALRIAPEGLWRGALRQCNVRHLAPARAVHCHLLQRWQRRCPAEKRRLTCCCNLDALHCTSACTRVVSTSCRDKRLLACMECHPIFGNNYNLTNFAEALSNLMSRHLPGVPFAE